MNLGAPVFHWRPRGYNNDRSTAWATVVAILFAAVAATSFALEQRVTLSSLPMPPPAATGR